MTTKRGGKPSERPTRRRWLVFFMAAATSWFLYLHRYTWNFIRPQLEDEYGFTNTELESLFSLFNVTYSVGQIPSGIACDYFGPHVFLSLIVLLWSLLLPGFGMTGSRTGLAGLRLAFGLCQAGAYPALTNVTRNWFPRSTRTAVQGAVASLAGRGGGAMSSIIMGSLLMGLLGLSWQASLWVLAAAGVLFALLFALTFRNGPEADRHANAAEVDLIRGDDPPPSDGPAMLPFGRTLRSRSLLVFVFQQFLNAGADYIYVAVMGSYFLTARRFDEAVAGLLVSLPLWGGALGGAAGGILNDGLIRLTGNRRWSRSAVGFLGKALASGCMLIAIQQQSGVAAALWLFVVKFFSDWTQPTVWGTCTDLGGRFSATVFSIVNTAGSVGMIVTPLFGGLLLDRYSERQLIDGVEQVVTNYNPLFAVVAGMYLASAACWLLIDCTRTLDRSV